MELLTKLRGKFLLLLLLSRLINSITIRRRKCRKRLWP